MSAERENIKAFLTGLAELSVKHKLAVNAGQLQTLFNGEGVQYELDPEDGIVTAEASTGI